MKYKNPEASSLAPDPTDRIILCFTAAPSQSYHYRIVVSLPQKETIRCVHFSTGMFLFSSNKHPLEDPSNKNEVLKKNSVKENYKCEVKFKLQAGRLIKKYYKSAYIMHR